MKVHHQIKIKHTPEYALALKSQRENMGLTQLEVAKKLHLSPMGLSHFECGTRPPNVAQLEKWANTLGLELNVTFTLLTTNKQEK